MTPDRYFGMSPRIARWRLDFPGERWLAALAGRSALARRLYVACYRVASGRYHRRGQDMARAVLAARADQWRGQDEAALVRDMVYCLHAFGIKFEEYWIYGFPHQDTPSRAAFVSDKLRYHYCDLLNAPGVRQLCTDKWACYQAFRPFFRREMVRMVVPADRAAFLDFAARHPRFVFKPLCAHSGIDIQMVDTAESPAADFFESTLAAVPGGGVAEQLIAQHDDMAAVHPQSVNSLRVMTFFLRGEAHILGVTWRIGAGAASVDNAGAGGMYASVDPATGIVQTDAADYLGHHYPTHPDTGVPFAGRRLPRWPEALALVRAMAARVQGTTLIAWDLACARDGWLMVEANDNGDWTIMQGNRQQGMKARLYALMDDYFNTTATPWRN